MKLYHSTIEARAEKILDEGLIPGKGNVMHFTESERFRYALGGVVISDPEYIYAWRDLDQAKKAALTVSRCAQERYQEDDRKPIVLEFKVDKRRVKNDPPSAPHGVRIKGSITPRQIKKLNIKLEKIIAK